MRYDARGHVIEAHGTRTVYMRLGPEGQSVGGEFSVADVNSPILSIGEVGQGFKFATGPTVCKILKGNRSVTLDVV